MKVYEPRVLYYFLLIFNLVIPTSSLFAQFSSGEHISSSLTDVTIRTFNKDTVIFAKANNIPAFIAKENQNLSSILDYMQITPYQFSLFNDLPRNSELEAGVVYYLRPKMDNSEELYHFKRPGESLWDISQAYGIKLKKLLKKNRLKSVIDYKDGQRIYLKKKRKSNERIIIDKAIAQLESKDPWFFVKQRFLFDYTKENEAPTGKAVTSNSLGSNYIKTTQFVAKGMHVVQPNETIFSISLDYGVTVLDIIEWNGLKNTDNVDEGTTLFIANPIGKQSTSPQNISVNQQQVSDQDKAILIGNSSGLQQNIYDTRLAVNQNKSELLNQEMIETFEHKAIKGDYVYKLSDTYKVMPQDIMRWNQLKGKAWLYIDDNVIIKKIVGLEENPRIHSVKKGETIYQISGLYKAKVKDLTLWNNLEGYTIYPGQDLIVSANGFIPRSNDSTTIIPDADALYLENKSNMVDISSESENSVFSTNEDFQYHVIQEGEDIYQIAAKYGQTIQNLRKWNDISYGQYLSVGKKIKVVKAKE